jgi:hypothetical protein
MQVDLAGSESAKRLHGKARLTEGSFINRSLLTLGMVIRKLAQGRGQEHAPYRDSRLTRLLTPALGGNARAAVICCLTPAADFADHSRETLKFAQRCSRVTNYAVINETALPKAVLLRR